MEHRLAQRRRGGSPTHPGGPGRFEMRAGHQCRNDGTHVDDVRATPSGSAFQDLRNRRAQLPSCPAPLHDKSCQLSRSSCLHFCAGRHLAAGRRLDAEPRTGWPRLWSAVSRPDQRHGFQFGRRRRGFGCGGRFLARAEVGHPGAKHAGSAVATEADRVSVLPHSARQVLRRGFRPGPFLLPESKPQATRS